MKVLYQKIIKDLFSHENREAAKKDRQNHKYEGYRSLGLSSPQLDRLLKQYKREIKQLSCGDIFPLAMKLYRHKIEDFTLAGNYVLQNRLECAAKDQLEFFDRALDNFCSWSTVDDFCIDVLQPVLNVYQKETLALLRKWNGSKSMWKRRASVVAFVRTVGESGKFTKEALMLCENLVSAPEDLVQKGVGWCLKDVMRGDKKCVLTYVEQLRKRGVPATITLYAIRDLKGSERDMVLNIK